MKEIQFKIIGVMLLLCLPLFSSCDSEDNVMEIFTGKTWKMSRLTDKGSSMPFYGTLWSSEKAQEESLEKLHNQENSFTLNFNGSEVNGETMGTTLNGRAITATFTGSWTVDADSRAMTISLTVTGTESDPLGKAFIAALKNVYKYEGDSNQLNLYYKDGQVERVMGFTHNK